MSKKNALKRNEIIYPVIIRKSKPWASKLQGKYKHQRFANSDIITIAFALNHDAVLIFFYLYFFILPPVRINDNE